MSNIPTPKCRHGMGAFVDPELGELDEHHIYCVHCGEVVCFNCVDPIRKTGKCRSCGTLMSETHKKQGDGIGTIQWVQLENGFAVDGGTI